MRPLMLALVGVLWVTPLRAQAEATDTAATAEPFTVGETLIYDVKFGFLTLGKGVMQVAGIDTVRATPSWHLVFVLQGGPFFYRLNDWMDSWIGISDFASRRFVQDFHEGGSFRYTAWDIFPDSGYYRQENIDSLHPTSPAPLDDAAFFYFVRTVDLEVGERYEFNRYFRPDRNPVILEVLGRDTLDLPAGRFPSIVVHPIIQGRGILAEGKEARLWLSDDDRKIVVQLKSKFPFGTITLRLKSIDDVPPSDLLPRPSEEHSDP